MVVLDSSALLCVLNGEAGAERVAQVLPSAVIGAVNLAEVVTKLRERGLSVDEVDDVLGGLNLDVRPLTAAQAYATGYMRPATRTLGLSLATAPVSRLPRNLAPLPSPPIRPGPVPRPAWMSR